MKDILLHALAAGLLAGMANDSKPGLVIAITILWLLRELAQRNAGNVLAALRTMPAWTWQKHAEWIAPGAAAAFVLFLHGMMGFP